MWELLRVVLHNPIKAELVHGSNVLQLNLLLQMFHTLLQSAFHVLNTHTSRHLQTADIKFLAQTVHFCTTEKHKNLLIKIDVPVITWHEVMYCFSSCVSIFKLYCF